MPNIAQVEPPADQRPPFEQIDSQLETVDRLSFRRFVESLDRLERDRLLAVLAEMHSGIAGAFVSDHILPDLEGAHRFAQLVAPLEETEVERFAINLAPSLEYPEMTRRWNSLFIALATDIPPADLRESIVERVGYLNCDDHFGQACDPQLLRFLGDWSISAPYITGGFVPIDGSTPWQIQLARAGREARLVRREVQDTRDFKRYLRVRPVWERDHICGAVYIGETYALTAAHCVKGWEGYEDEFFDNRQLRVGTQNITGRSGQLIGIRSVIMHAAYDPNKPGHHGYDIALIELDAVPAGDDVSRAVPARAARAGLPNSTVLLVTGWGLTGATTSSGRARDDSDRLQRSAGVLRGADMTLVSSARCDDDPDFKKFGARIGTAQLCLLGEGEADSCRGDSGGPVVFRREGREPVLVALVSWGPGCGQRGTPGLYTDVGALADWVNRAKAATADRKFAKLR